MSNKCFNLKVQTLEAVVFLVKSSACFFSRKVCHKLINLGGRVKLVHTTQAATKRLFCQSRPSLCGFVASLVTFWLETLRFQGPKKKLELRILAAKIQTITWKRKENGLPTAMLDAK